MSRTTSSERTRKNIKITPNYRFGHITVLEKTDQRKRTSIVWRCRCDCGNEVLLDTTAIRLQRRTDCGCITKLPPQSNDLTGRRFGKLTILEPTEKRRDRGSVVWHCRCDCGREVEVPASRLMKGKVRSCGCLFSPGVKDYIGKRFGRLTVVEYLGKTRKNTKMNYWRCRCDCGNETIVSQSELQSGSTQSCGCYRNEQFRESLRLIDGTSVTLLEYSKNHLKVNNKSGYTGVFWDERRGKWTAAITFKRKRYYLGSYDEKMDAVRARKRGEETRDHFLDWYYKEFKEEPSEGKTGMERDRKTEDKEQHS